MGPAAWTLCLSLVAVALGLGAHGASVASADERRRALARLASPLVWLVTAYLGAAALLVPVSDGESASPLAGLALGLPALYFVAGLAARPRPLAARVAVALVLGAAMLSVGLVTLALVSPRFVPSWAR
jgi:hypothetical protein